MESLYNNRNCRCDDLDLFLPKPIGSILANWSPISSLALSSPETYLALLSPPSKRKVKIIPMVLA